MSRIRSKNTKPEMIVRKGLWSRGFRYRLNSPKLPGHPDLVLRKYRTCIFINGCFWHGHHVDFPQSENSECCKIPKTNREFWVAKIRRNQERDQKNYGILCENGWQVIVVWECQLKPALIEQTMRQVEVLLQEYFLQTFSRKAKPYIHLEEELPMAAEDLADYGVE